jgi:hypothetical protein
MLARHRGGGNDKVTLSWLGGLRGADEEVEGIKVELLAGLEARWHGGKCVRAHQSKGGNGGSVSPFW